MTKIVFWNALSPVYQNLHNFTQITVKVRITCHFESSTFENVFTNLNPMLKIKRKEQEI